MSHWRIVGVLLLGLAAPAARAADDVLLADFEQATYGDWTATGTAFGPGPAEGTLPNQMPVSGFKGKRLVNSFAGGDRSTGTLTSPEFKIERKYIAFLIGGGGHEGKTCVDLVIDGKVVRTATGVNTAPGGTEALDPGGWDVADLAGKTARIRVVDDFTGGWGHINLDHVVLTDTKPSLVARDASRQIAADRKLLLLPVKNGTPVRTVTVSAGGEAVRRFTIEAADGPADWWATLDVSAWKGQPLTVHVDKLGGDSTFLSSLETADAPRGEENLYREPLRQQFHFSAARGWLNDPNGLVYYNGEYHLFFQHNPYGTKWGNMHWGHAVSTDLVRWKQLDIALYPDRFGTMFSGSAVVDWKNTSGLGVDGKPPLVLLYTAAGADVQCLAHSTDGRSFTKYDKNPIVPRITGGNRDPKVIWHEPTGRWVMTLYVRLPGADGKDAGGRDTIHVLTSPDLKAWTVTDVQDGFYECPDLFPLPLDGDAGRAKWVLFGADGAYKVGAFDGRTFKPETPKLPGPRGGAMYAAQTFSDLPATDGRRILIGWLRTPTPGMPFSQCMTVPTELKLVTTPDGPRMTYLPTREVETLRTGVKPIAPADLTPAGDNPLAAVTAELLDVRLEFDPADAADVTLDLRGVPLHYDARKKEWDVGGQKVLTPGGPQKVVALVDRNSVEVFLNDGLGYVPLAASPKAGQPVTLTAKGGTAKVLRGEAHELKSIW